MFKYAALVLLEIVESQTLVCYLDITLVQQTVLIASFFAIWYDKTEDINPSDNIKINEV